MKGGSITDWIQTVAVVIGVGFALWEFVLNDRIQDNNRKSFTSSLILKGAEGWFVESLKSFARVDGKHGVERDDVANMKPLEVLYDAWGFCYENNLCDKGLARKYVCEDLVAFSDFLKRNFRDRKPDQDYGLLLSDCMDDSGGSSSLNIHRSAPLSSLSVRRGKRGASGRIVARVQ